MPTTSELVLRPRFTMELPQNNETILATFEARKTTQTNFKITRVDDHVFIRLPTHQQHFWSPELHLEINHLDATTSKLHGLFGPKPQVWTLFMFLHFFVAGLFIAFGIWTYTNWRLKNPYGIQLGLMLLMVVIWFVLYIAGRWGRHKGKAEMQLMHDFMNETLGNCQLV